MMHVCFHSVAFLDVGVVLSHPVRVLPSHRRWTGRSLSKFSIVWLIETSILLLIGPGKLSCVQLRNVTILKCSGFLCYFRVQELIAGEQRETGRIPRTLECHLTADLCDSCVPGDMVTVTGIVRAANDGTDL